MGMATIYAPPESVEVPEINFQTWQEDEKKFIEELKDFCKTHGKGSEKGELIRIPHADGYAQYVVFSLRPVELIHVPTGDAWDSPYAELLTAKKIKEMIRADKAMEALIARNAKKRL